MQNWMQVKLQFMLSSSAENMSSFHDYGWSEQNLGAREAVVQS
jgi:hypothetical protein